MPPQRLSSKYESGLVEASRSALLELSLTLGAFRDSIVIVGGWAPYFLIEEYGPRDFPHIGSIDIDLAVNPDTIDEDSYAGIIERIEARGYSQKKNRQGEPIFFSYIKPIRSIMDGKEYQIQVDFLTSRDFTKGIHRHRTVQENLRARVCEECETAFSHNFTKRIAGTLPGNGEAEADIMVVDISGSLGMKGIVLGDRYKEKDAYDIFTIVSECRENPAEVAKEVGENLDDTHIGKGVELIRERFGNIGDSGPAWVADFLHPTDTTARDRKIAEVYVKMKEFIDSLPE